MINLAEIRDFFSLFFLFFSPKISTNHFMSTSKFWKCHQTLAVFSLISVNACYVYRYKLHGSMAKTQISDLQNASLLSKLSRYPPNSSASPVVSFARDSCRYTPNGKFARGPIGETMHVWVTRKIRVLWKASSEGYIYIYICIIYIYIYIYI